MNSALALIIGFTGMCCVLLAFTLLVFKRSQSHDKEYLWLNLGGSTLLIVYALDPMAPPFLILNAIWASVALWGLLHHHGGSKHNHTIQIGYR